MDSASTISASISRVNLKGLLLKGGVYLAMRQGIGTLIALVGTVVLTKEIGPENYGTFAAALGIYTYLFNIGQMGVGVYLIRKGEATVEDFRQAFCLLFLVCAVLCLISILLTGKLQTWMHLPNFEHVASLLFPVLFFPLLSSVPIAILERRFEYKKIATAELVGQILFYLIAVGSALNNCGALSPVFGLWAQQASAFFLYLFFARFVPRWHWERAHLSEMVRYGTSYSISSWTWRLRDLFLPIVVVPTLGAASVGHIALGNRIIETLGFVKGVVWRISVSAISRVQDDREEVCALTQKMLLMQVAGISVVLAAFYAIAPFAVKYFVGVKWLPMLDIFPYLAIAFVTGAAFNIMSTGLSVFNHNEQVTIFHLVYITALYLSGLLLLPRYGMTGYGISELAALPTFLFLFATFKNKIGKIDLTKPISCIVLFGVLMALLAQIQG